ncbi:hypothetical protein VTO42DRAFT_6299 [Malbranchea cinnamomea]
MPRRNSALVSKSSQHTVTASSAQPRHATNTDLRNSKRKRESTNLTEEVTPTTSRSAKRARTGSAIRNGNVPVIDLTSSPSSRRSAPRQKKPESGGSPVVRTEEKRLRMFRKHPPQSYLLKLERARVQRLCVLKRSRTGTDEVPEEVIDIVGSTGNVYAVHIGKLPSCTCPDSQKGNQCKHIVYVLYNVLRAPSHLQYQLAFLSSELREIFQNAPPSPTETASTEDTEGNRKPVDGDCPICFMEFDPKSETIVWCKASCGNNVHETCFKQWAASQGGKEVRCVYCRTPWQYDTPPLKDIWKQGYINDEGYLNVGRVMGLPEERDYSTYHQPPRWRFGYYRYN